MSTINELICKVCSNHCEDNGRCFDCEIRPNLCGENIIAVEYISSDAELSDDEDTMSKWNVCEICYTRIYDGDELLDENRCDEVYFCNQECLDLSQLEMIECESCGEIFREDKITDDRCEVCIKDYLNWLDNNDLQI